MVWGTVWGTLWDIVWDVVWDIVQCSVNVRMRRSAAARMQDMLQVQS